MTFEGTHGALAPRLAGMASSVKVLEKTMPAAASMLNEMLRTDAEMCDYWAKQAAAVNLKAAEASAARAAAAAAEAAAVKAAAAAVAAAAAAAALGGGGGAAAGNAPARAGGGGRAPPQRAMQQPLRAAAWGMMYNRQFWLERPASRRTHRQGANTPRAGVTASVGHPPQHSAHTKTKTVCV
jgi:hypothetical protein